MTNLIEILPAGNEAYRDPAVEAVILALINEANSGNRELAINRRVIAEDTFFMIINAATGREIASISLNCPDPIHTWNYEINVRDIVSCRITIPRDSFRNYRVSTVAVDPQHEDFVTAADIVNSTILAAVKSKMFGR